VSGYDTPCVRESLALTCHSFSLLRRNTPADDLTALRRFVVLVLSVVAQSQQVFCFENGNGPEGTAMDLIGRICKENGASFAFA
jgi:hypothetical protein